MDNFLIQNEYRTIELENRNNKFLDDEEFMNDAMHSSENDKRHERMYDNKDMLYSLFKVNKWNYPLNFISNNFKNELGCHLNLSTFTFYRCGWQMKRKRNSKLAFKVVTIKILGKIKQLEGRTEEVETTKKLV